MENPLIERVFCF